eukprot:740574-Ditylum_brightwellii.AAC.1
MPPITITAWTSQASQPDLLGQPIHSNRVNSFPQETDGVNLGTAPIESKVPLQQGQRSPLKQTDMHYHCNG